MENNHYECEEVKVIITGFTVTHEGVIFETNIPAKLKPNRMPSKKTYVSWDKIGTLLFECYASDLDVSELKKLRGH